MWIVACCAIHTALIVCAHFPILPAETRVAVTAPAQVRSAINRRGCLGMLGRHGVMTCFTRYSIRLICCSCGVIAGGVTNETGAGLALLRPLIQKDRVTASLSMRSALPGGLKFGMTCRAIGRGCLCGRGYAILRAGNHKCNARGKQGKHQGDQ